MTTIQSNVLAMLRAVQVFLTALLSSPTATSLFPALAEKFATLKTLITKIAALAATQEAPTGGLIQDREKSMAETADATLAVASGVLSYARTFNLNDLIAKVEINRSDFDRMRMAERMRLAQRVHDAALPLIAELAPYGVTQAQLTDLQRRIALTDDAVDAPVDTSAAKKVATAELVKAFGAVERLLAEMDPLLFPLKAADPKAYARYLAARQVFDPRGSHRIPVGDTPTAPAAPAPDPAPVAPAPPPATG